MTTLHISQDGTKCWQLSFEDNDGTLTLISHQFPSPDHLIDDARDLVANGKVPKGTGALDPHANGAAAHRVRRRRLQARH